MTLDDLRLLYLEHAGTLGQTSDNGMESVKTNGVSTQITIIERTASTLLDLSVIP